MQTDIQKALKTQVEGLASSQVQKQLGLSDKAYNLFSKSDFGLLTEQARNSTSLIYTQLSKNSSSAIKDTFSLINKYFNWFVYAISALFFIVLIIPVLFVWWIAKKLSSNFTECPYCKKVFLSKEGSFNLLKFFKKT